MAFQPVRAYKARGRYPATEYQVRHLFRNRGDNGLGPAFTKLGGRVLFDPERLEQLLADRARADSAA